MARRAIDGWSIRWDEARAETARNDGWWSDETLSDHLPRLAVDDPDRVLLDDVGVQLTASDLHNQAIRLAGWLQARFNPGEVVSFMLPNWHEAAIVYFAATYSGMVANPIPPSLRDHDLRFILSDCRSRVVFAPEEFRGFSYSEMLRRVASTIENPPAIVVVRGGGDITLSNLMDASAAVQPLRPAADAVRMVMYTSGTTGKPKGVMHTHNSLSALLKQIGEHWHVATGDRFLVPSPISHIGGSIYAFEAPVLLGSSAILMDRWDPLEALQIMQHKKITHMAGATPFLEGLLGAAKEANAHLPDLKVFICGGASVPPSLVESAARWFEKARVSRVYGSTEVPVTTVGALEKDAMPQAALTDGKPGIAKVRLSAEGEILARGPQMLAGYIRQDDEVAAFDEDGFYRTGDQGQFDADGFLTVTGRIKDLIIRNGENIAPKEIEDLLIALPEIADIAIVGVPDPKTGERACAVVVPAEGATPDVAFLAQYLAELGVAKFKYPETVELREGLPRNDAGKVLKHVLRAELTG